MSDFYRTVQDVSTAVYKEKMSKFIAFVEPAATAEQARAAVKRYQNQYHDARHVCWAYVMGVDRAEQMSNDNGEPSGTAGKPILGQLNARELTRVVAVVVRYFGGIKLGTSGLIAAYREATRLAIDAASVLELHEQARHTVQFPYIAMNAVMGVVKKSRARIVEQQFDNLCSLTLECDADALPALQQQLSTAINGF